MKIFNFKKAQGVISNWPFWIMFGIAVAVVALILVNIANVNIADVSTVPEGLEDEIVLISRFYNSEDCFAYEDEMERVHMGVIDSSKFEENNMEKCFPRSSVNYAFSLSLEITQPPTFNKGPIKTFNWEKGFAEKEIIEDVFVLHDDTKYQGELIIKIKNVQ
jgi:hypothetical protein|tara:strand:+ start:119 stop:604 length:486 start_codon:yes stop_codon:yes gene_type:complete